MKQYRLLRDTPYHGAGTIVTKNAENSYYEALTKQGSPVAYWCDFVEKHPELFKEVKRLDFKRDEMLAFANAYVLHHRHGFIFMNGQPVVTAALTDEQLLDLWIG